MVEVVVVLARLALMGQEKHLALAETDFLATSRAQL
jgi:hypothetical protein